MIYMLIGRAGYCIIMTRCSVTGHTRLWIELSGIYVMVTANLWTSIKVVTETHKLLKKDNLMVISIIECFLAPVYFDLKHNYYILVILQYQSASQLQWTIEMNNGHRSHQNLNHSVCELEVSQVTCGEHLVEMIEYYSQGQPNMTKTKIDFSTSWHLLNHAVKCQNRLFRCYWWSLYEPISTNVKFGVLTPEKLAVPGKKL